MTTALILDSTGSKGPAWQLVRATFVDHYQVVVEGTTSRIQRRRQYTIGIQQHIFGVVSIKPSNNTSKSQFSLATGPESRVDFAWSGGNRKFICSYENLDQIDFKTGEYKWVQEWIHFSQWADVPDSEFGTTNFSD